MVEAALRSGAASRRCVFEVFARRLPEGRRYGVVAGTGRLLEAIEAFRFGEAELAWLREAGVVDEPTLAFLADYRFDGDVEALTAAVKASASGPVIAAGSVDSLERIAALRRIGVWGFTIGGAIFEGRFAGAPSVPAQIETVLAALA